MSKINLSEFTDRVSLLRGLWEAQRTASFFAIVPRTTPTFDENKAKTAVKGYIDYFCGRAIKTDLSKDTIDPYLYDRDAGTGTFQRVVNNLLKK